MLKSDPQIEETALVSAEMRGVELKKFLAKAEKSDSNKITDLLENYFIQKIDSKIENRCFEKSREIIKSIEKLRSIYTNETLICTKIRKGEYEPGIWVDVSDSLKDRSIKLKFKIAGQLDYFDMMVLDAIYTLYFNGKKIIYPRHILQLLSGDPKAQMKPEKKKAFEASLDKLKNAHLWIDRSSKTDKGSNYHYIVNGQFLKFKLVGKRYSGYEIEETPILWKYAEDNLNRIRTIPLEYLFVIQKNNDKPLAHSIENLKLRHYLARRLVLSDPMAILRNHHHVIRKIRLTPDKKHGRAGLFKMLGINFEEDTYLYNRKMDNCCHKVSIILQYFVKNDFLVDYKGYKDKNDIEIDSSLKGADGVELKYITSSLFNKS